MSNNTIDFHVPEFRAYDKENGIMIHDFDQSVAKHYNMSWGSSIHQKVYDVGLLYKTLSQFTGETDYDGKKVYVGDLLTDVYCNDFVTIFSNGCYRAQSLDVPRSINLCDMEVYSVVGNIFMTNQN